MRLMTIFCVVLFSSAALAQISPEEAMRRLEERRRQAATNPAATQSAPTTRVVRPPEELHAEAVQLMRVGQFAKASPLIDQAHRMTPPERLTRALILNRAIVDFMRGDNSARAVKDVSSYLVANPTDEVAVDLLGAAGKKTVDRSPRFGNTALARDAERILVTAIARLEATRPGMRKWGGQWLTADGFRAIEQRRAAAQRDYDSAVSRLRSEEVRLASARQSAGAANTIDTNLGTRRTGRRNSYDAIAANQQQEQERRARAQEQIARAEAEFRAARAQVEAARRQLVTPDWPSAFEPVDPTAPVAVPAAPNPPAAAPGVPPQSAVPPLP